MEVKQINVDTIEGVVEKNLYLLMDLGTTIIVYNPHKHQMSYGVKPTKQLMRKAITVVKEHVRVKEEVIMDGFTYFLHHFVTSNPEKSFDLYAPREHFLEKVKNLNCIRGRNIRNLYDAILNTDPITNGDEFNRLCSLLTDAVAIQTGIRLGQRT